MGARWITPAELADATHDPDAAADLVGSGISALVVDLRGGTAEIPAQLASVPVPVIAVSNAHDRARGWVPDVVVRLGSEPVAAPAVALDDNGLTRLLSAIDYAPLAAATLALLLRGHDRRTIEDGLVAESMAYSMLQGSPEFRAWRERTPRRPADDTDRERVRVARDHDLLTITLLRAHRHNAVDTPMRDALAAALGLAVADDSIRRVEVRGDGPSFSSGGDLDEFGSFPDPTTAHRSRLARSPARLMAQLADRVTVRLHGACMGAGIEVPAFAGRVIASADARIALPEVRYGLVPGAGGTVSVASRVGRHRCAYLALSGEVISAHTALDWGLVDAVEP